MTSVIKGGKFGHRGTQRDSDVKRHREKMATYKPRSEAWNRSFSHNPQNEPVLPTT